MNLMSEFSGSDSERDLGCCEFSVASPEKSVSKPSFSIPCHLGIPPAFLH